MRLTVGAGAARSTASTGTASPRRDFTATRPSAKSPAMSRASGLGSETTTGIWRVISSAAGDTSTTCPSKVWSPRPRTWKATGVPAWMPAKASDGTEPSRRMVRGSMMVNSCAPSATTSPDPPSAR